MDEPDPREGSEPLDIEGMTSSLKAHALEAAARARGKLRGNLGPENLATFLTDSDCLRVPTRIEFGGGDLEPNQFADPIFYEEAGRRYCVLRFRPKYSDRPEQLPYLVAYMAAAINYGLAAGTELCESYGAALVGMEVEEFYTAVCSIVDE